MNKIKLDLDNPIFTFYVDITSVSRQKAEEMMADIRHSMDIYENVTIWFVASDQNKIECVYSGKRTESNLDSLIESINERIDILSKSNNFEDFKINIRDWRLDNLINI
jgi:hypothetical protein